MNINTILNSGDVVRFHNHSGIDKQRNSEHQWGVALVLNYIYPNASKELILAAMTHDAAEYYTGDVPFPVKKDHPELSHLLRKIEKQWEACNDVYFDYSQIEELALKVSDTLEGMKYCIKQVRLGNINAKRPFRKWSQFFIDNLLSKCEKTLPKSLELFSKLLREMEEL